VLSVRRYWSGSAKLLLSVEQLSSLVQQCYEVVEFPESLGDELWEPIAVNLEVQSRRSSGGNLGSKIIDLVKDCDQVGRCPRTDQTLHIMEFVQEAAPQEFSSGFQVFDVPRIRTGAGGPLFEPGQSIPHLRYKQARPCDEAEDFAIIIPDRLSPLFFQRVFAIFSTAGCLYLLNSVCSLLLTSLS
jgi:hypothetical protein